jgi:tetratricopeptide (TPR) repeat protein
MSVNGFLCVSAAPPETKVISIDRVQGIMLKNTTVKRIVIIAFCFVLNAAFAHADTGPSPEELKKEIAFYTELLKRDNNAKYLNALGFAYYRLHRMDEAMDAYKKAAASDPEYALTYNNLGVAYLNLKEYARAEDAFRTALKLDAQYTKAAYNLSVALFRQRKYLDAYTAYRLAKKIDAGYVKKRMNDSHARDEINEELRKDPDNKLLRELAREMDAEK